MARVEWSNFLTVVIMVIIILVIVIIISRVLVVPQNTSIGLKPIMKITNYILKT